MKIYFAHSQLSYNTPEEAEQLAYLETLGTVICPNRDIMAKGKKDYQTRQNECDTVICAEFMGFVGRGVASGVQDFLILEKPAYVIRSAEEGVSSKFALIPILGLKEVEKERDWKVRYATLVLDTDDVGMEEKDEGTLGCY